MKRKFISVALFGALLAASTSVTTSCKDYDDDISGLQGQITANATNLDELVNEKVNNLTQEINSLKAQEAALETALATAKTELTATIAEAEQGAKDYADIQAAAARLNRPRAWRPQRRVQPKRLKAQPTKMRKR